MVVVVIFYDVVDRRFIGLHNGQYANYWTEDKKRRHGTKLRLRNAKKQDNQK